MSATSPEAEVQGWDCHVHVFEPGGEILPGHYQPAHHSLDELRSHAQSAGIGRFVLVQPSVYGSDNSVLLRALKNGEGNNRGVIVIDSSSSPDEIDELHQLGVRGIRFNHRSPIGPLGEPDKILNRWVDGMTRLGWHVQWYIRPGDLDTTWRIHQDYGLPCVLDHLAGFDAGFRDAPQAWEILLKLAHWGAWIKASGWYRLGATAPYLKLRELLLAVVDAFGERVVWGSDWPHTSYEYLREQPYRVQLDPLQWLDSALSREIQLSHPRQLYR